MFPPPPDFIMLLTGFVSGNSFLTISPIFVLTSLRTFKIFISLDSSFVLPGIISSELLSKDFIISSVFFSAFLMTSLLSSITLSSRSKSSTEIVIPLSERCFVPILKAFFITSNVFSFPNVLSISLINSPDSFPRTFLSTYPSVIIPSFIVTELFEKLTFGNIFENNSEPVIVFFVNCSSIPVW